MLTHKGVHLYEILFCIRRKSFYINSYVVAMSEIKYKKLLYLDLVYPIHSPNEKYTITFKGLWVVYCIEQGTLSMSDAFNVKK